jgi:hypothetical protein
LLLFCLFFVAIKNVENYFIKPISLNTNKHNIEQTSMSILASTASNGLSCKLNDTTNNHKQLVESMSGSMCDYIEEEKAFLNGINVRAAKLSKLIQILIESFNCNGRLHQLCDLPRVFFLMHKWFIESQKLANTLLDLYEAQNTTNDSKLGICYAIQYWITTYPLHFAMDANLVEVIRNFISLIESTGNKEHRQLVDMSNM